MTTVTGKTSSRLIELEKYVRSTDISKKYVTGGSVTFDGVDVTASSANTVVVYYIGGIEYTDNYEDGLYDDTDFLFNINNSTADIQQVDLPIIKDFSKGNVVGRPEVKSDVFIERQSLSIFEQQFRLRYIGNLSELNFYAGGGNFNIIENT